MDHLPLLQLPSLRQHGFSSDPASLQKRKDIQLDQNTNVGPTPTPTVKALEHEHARVEENLQRIIDRDQSGLRQRGGLEDKLRPVKELLEARDLSGRKQNGFSAFQQLTCAKFLEKLAEP